MMLSDLGSMVLAILPEIGLLVLAAIDPGAGPVPARKGEPLVIWLDDRGRAGHHRWLGRGFCPARAASRS